MTLAPPQQAGRTGDSIVSDMSPWNYVVTWYDRSACEYDFEPFITKPRADELFQERRRNKERYSEVFLCAIIEGRFADDDKEPPQ